MLKLDQQEHSESADFHHWIHLVGG